MPEQPLAILGSIGWVTDPYTKADRMLSHFVAVNYSQNPFFPVESSLPWLLQRYEGLPNDLAEKSQEVLEVYFKSNYSAAKVECRANPDPQNPNNHILSIRVDLRIEDGRTLDLGRLVTYAGTTFLQIAAMNNGSLPTTG